VPSLKDYGTKDRDATTLRLDDIAGEQVTINDAELREGNFGTFAVLSLIRESGELATVITGGLFVLDAIKDVMGQDGFPVTATFFRRGRTWLFE